MPEKSAQQLRIEELERALDHERRVSAAERRRSEALEDSLKRAYRFAAGACPRDRTSNVERLKPR